MTKKKTLRAMTLTLALLIVAQAAGISVLAALFDSVQPAPERLRVEAKIAEGLGAEPAIGYNEFDKYYVDLRTDSIRRPENVPSPSIYMNYYLQEIGKPYKPVVTSVLKEGNVPANISSDNIVRLKELKSGTIYYAHAKAYYTYNVDSVTYTSIESNSSNTVKFMTDIAISAMSYGPNQIKIEWDDVWNSGKRMDYKLYISEDKTFANSKPIYIGQMQIGQNGPVKVNEASGKLEYIHTVRDPGRVYYIRIEADTAEIELKRSPSSPTVAVSSYILARTTKMSTTDAGTIWRLEWSPVVPGISGTGIEVTYDIYRGTTAAGGNADEFFSSTQNTSTVLTLQPGDENRFFIIKAIVRQNGQDMYPGIEITSQRIFVKESEVPSTPAVPELVPEFRDGERVIISYKGSLTPNSAVILWRAPMKGNGEVDTDVMYDIWLITDPNLIDNPPQDALIASSVKMAPANEVRSGGKLYGYKYTLNDLMPNSTYYFKIVAKKDYVEFADDGLQYITLRSDAAMKTIITPKSGEIHQPLIPNVPPFELKKDKDGKDMITGTSVVVTLRNAWYEEYSDERYPDAEAPGGQRWGWYYRTPDQINAAGAASEPPFDVYDLETHYDNDPENDAESVDLLKFRKVEYDPGVTIDVGCVEYSQENFNKFISGELSADKIISFPVTANDPDEDITHKDAVRDNKYHIVDIPIYGLEPNKAYIIWIRAVRRGAALFSEASEPIIVTTIPFLEEELESPTVPVFNYSYAGDTYIDLGWNFNSKYIYKLLYGTVDDPKKAGGSVNITPDMLEHTTYYRVGGLTPDTVYYFWIQAEASNSAGDKKTSELSDSYVVRTQKDIPPDTPLGFGVKGTKDSVTKNSITYEWIPQEGMEYVLEIDDDIDYKDSTRYEIKGASEFTVGNLRSNFRYYARLYAYDPLKKLHSAPTQSVIVRTLRSSDDYDSSEDAQDVITGDYIIKDKTAVNGVWNISITGVNADRLVQRVHTDSVLDYTIDLKTMPEGTKTISVRISQRVFRALGMLGENLILRTNVNELIIRPGVLADKNGTYYYGSHGAELAIEITPQSTAEGDIANMTFKTPVSKVAVNVLDGLSSNITKFQKPLKVAYEYGQASWYKPGSTFGYYLPEGMESWQKTTATGSFDPDISKGRLTFEMKAPGKMAAADQGHEFYEDISRSYAVRSIGNVAATHELRSVKGKKFEPAKNLTLGDGVKFMLDVLDADYGTDYMTLAAKAGIIKSADISKVSSYCTREQLISMAMRVCELKTAQKAVSDQADLSVYKDVGQVTPSLLPRIRYAHNNGIITSRFSDTFGPSDIVTRAEAMVLLEKVLRFAGEL